MESSTIQVSENGLQLVTTSTINIIDEILKNAIKCLFIYLFGTNN